MTSNKKTKQTEFKLQIVVAAMIIVFCVFLIGCTAKQRIYHVGILCGLNSSIIIGDNFKVEMAKLGYVEGKNIIYDYYKTNFEPDKEKQILEKFVADKVDLIFGFNTEVALEAKEATKGTDIPVLFAMGTTEGTNLIDSTSAPGEHITGVRYPVVDFAIMRFEILQEILPSAERIWVPHQKNYPTVKPEFEALRPQAISSNVTLIEFPCNNLTELQAEMERMSKSLDRGFDAVLYIPESLSTSIAAFNIIANYTRDRKIPIAGTKQQTEDYGTIFSVSVDYSEESRLAAEMADKILRGADAGKMLVISPNPYIVVNYKVMQELNLTVPEGLLARADEIIR